jgi:hypothetical protein
MPLGFQFADEPNPASEKAGISDSDRDPGKVQLVPVVVDEKGSTKNGQRMASPVITRPLCVKGEWQPAVILLRTRELAKLTAQLVVGKKPINGGRVSSSQISGAELSSCGVMRGRADALSAFEQSLSKEFFQLPSREG